MNKVFLVRHGENKANITKEFSYKLVDYPLTPKGVIQARQTAEYFVDKNIHEIYCSPLKRAQETARIIAERLNLGITVLENFRELNVGELECSPASQESWAICDAVINDWNHGKLDTSFPEGENYHMLLERMMSGLKIVLEGKSNKNIIIVGHHGIFSETIRDVCQNVDFESLCRMENNNCSISELELEVKEGSVVGILKNWAYCSHMHGEASEFISPLPKY